MLKNISVLIPLLFLGFCSLPKNELTVVDLRSSGMGFQRDGKMVALTNSARLVFTGDTELYISPESHFNLEYIKDSLGVVIDERVKSIDTTHVVYVRRKNQKRGMEYSLERMDGVPGVSFDADSLWKTLSFYNKSMKKFDADIGRPIKVIEKGNMRIEKYAMKFEIGQMDSIYKYYDKGMKYIPYSFSEKYDALNDSKLFKLYGIANEIPKGVALPDMAVPRREFTFEMKVINEKNLEKYLEILKRFEQDSKTMNLN